MDNVINVTDLNASVLADNENFILGTSTWGAGEMQDDWYDGIKTLKGADLSGKTVALFGCGDSGRTPTHSWAVWLSYTMPLRRLAPT